MLMERNTLKYFRQNAVGHASTVFVPACSVLAAVTCFIPQFTMDQQNCQVNRVEEWNQTRKTWVKKEPYERLTLGERENGRARRRHAPLASPSRAPVFSCAHYFQAPATQASWHLTSSISVYLFPNHCFCFGSSTGTCYSQGRTCNIYYFKRSTETYHRVKSRQMPWWCHLDSWGAAPRPTNLRPEVVDQMKLKWFLHL